MRFEFVAHLEDGTDLKVHSDARDLRRWEAEYKKTMVGESLSFTYLTQICYIAARRSRVLEGRFPTYQLFDEACIDLDMKRLSADPDAELVANPTPPEVTDVS